MGFWFLQRTPYPQGLFLGVTRETDDRSGSVSSCWADAGLAWVWVSMVVPTTVVSDAVGEVPHAAAVFTLHPFDFVHLLPVGLADVAPAQLKRVVLTKSLLSLEVQAHCKFGR